MYQSLAALSLMWPRTYDGAKAVGILLSPTDTYIHKMNILDFYDGIYSDV